MPTPIYLDYNATTPMDPQALDAMLPFFRDHFGNASSEHSFGWTADEAVKQARERTARLIGATPRTMVFTSGATEAVSLAIRGAGEVYGGRRHRIVTVRTEHRAVLATCEAMEREGYETTYLSVGPDGLIAAWGTCGSCPADFDQNGEVNIADLLTLIAAWGPCP